jgi:hypothetical protein
MTGTGSNWPYGAMSRSDKIAAAAAQGDPEDDTFWRATAPDSTSPVHNPTMFCDGEPSCPGAHPAPEPAPEPFPEGHGLDLDRGSAVCACGLALVSCEDMLRWAVRRAQRVALRRARQDAAPGRGQS